MKRRSIIYVNFSQYDNTGRILDYLKENFVFVLHFSFDHLRLKRGKRVNFLTIYRNKVEIKKIRLFSLRTPSFLLFPSLPIVGVLMIAQTIYYSYIFKIKYGKIDYFFSVNAFSAWIGLLIKLMRIVDKSVFWVWDYFPISYPDWRLKFARYIYWQFDKPCMLWSDRIVFTNSKLYRLRKNSNHLRREYKPIIVPIGSAIKKITLQKKKKVIIGFLGMLKPNQGVGLWANHFDLLVETFPKIKLEVIGSGPEENYYKEKLSLYRKNIKYFGFVEDQDKIFKIIRRWSAGLATYLPDVSNESYWGDPSKIKTYMSAGVPIITTNVSHVSKKIEESHAGVIIPYTGKGLLYGIKKVIGRNLYYSRASYSLAKDYDYKEIYKKFFS